MQLDNKKVGRNISRFRKLKDIKAFDLAEQLGLKEAAYTKYERGETAITIDFIQKVADILEVDAVQLMTASPSNIIENFQHSSISINGTSHYNASDKDQTETMLKLMESIIQLNERVLALQEKK